MLASARYNHLYAFRIHRKLVELDAGDERTRKLLTESAALVLQEMPTLTREWKTLEREWSEQELLDPPKAERTAQTLALRFAELGQALEALRVREGELVAELLRLLKAARRT